MRLCAIAPLIARPGTFPEGRIDLCDGLSIVDTPVWLPKRIAVTRPFDCDLQSARRSLLYEYEAPSIAESGNHFHHYDQLKLAALGLWLAKPNPVSFSVAIHATDPFGDPVDSFAEQSDSWFKPHEKDLQVSLTDADIAKARVLIQGLKKLWDRTVGKDDSSATWMATSSCMKALMEGWWPTRYLTVWIGIESLFGAEDGREIGYRMSHRMGWFLGKDRIEAKNMFDAARDGYRWRSLIAHGRSLKRLGDKSADVLYAAERMLQTSLRRILADTDLAAKFDSSAREEFLDALAFASTP